MKVVFVAGTGRSGSTLIANVVGQLPGAHSLGELRYFWERGMAEDQVCGCGRRFATCPFWNAVVDTLHRSRPGLDRQEAGRLAHRLDSRLRVRDVPAMAMRRLVGRPAIPASRDDATILAMYAAIAAHLPEEAVIVDSSKLPPYALLLSSLPGIELRVLHVVRDPRATAYSWRRHKATREGTAAEMPRNELWRSAVIWLLWNLLVTAWWRADEVLHVGYEAFAAQPAEQLGRVADWLGTEVPDTLVVGSTLHLGPTHTVAGNPDRLASGATRVRVDDEWVRAMPRLARTWVTLLTLPGLRRFGYPVRP